MASKKRKKVKKKAPRNKRGRARASVAKRGSKRQSLRSGMLVTRKPSAAALRSLGMTAKVVGKVDGKTTYKLTKKRGSTRVRRVPSIPAVDPRVRASTGSIRVGQVLVSPGGWTMRWVTFYLVKKIEGDNAYLARLGQKYTHGDSQNGNVIPDRSDESSTLSRGKISGDEVRLAGRSYARPWDGKPESVYGD